ncbi:hypothetical protein BDY19DRAFT_916239 [Irpex rosettiformis]|uniref:Uncharacterized protein n=1 Tax=Irpex rosettiformis TaxID=378272 RepID=A0ACB8UL28_9APHY|nr:hypothetical protein BDY19DRAFT_916239 [Irpex rosettiformis]
MAAVTSTPPSAQPLLAQDVLSPSSGVCFERKMGDTEASYFLPSRQTGVNDMYLHLGFRAEEHVVDPARVRAVWAILRLRHPLLAASVKMHEYDDIRFVYKAPASSRDLLQEADANLEYQTRGKDALIDTYLNGPRTLSNTRLSYLIVSQPTEDEAGSLTPPLTPPLETASNGAPAETRQYDLLICAMHFIGDGMALHQFANDFFTLLGSEKTTSELESQLESEWSERWANIDDDAQIIPSALEDNIPIKWSKLRGAAARIDFDMVQQKQIGGQSFPRRKHSERRTVVPTLSFPEDKTKAMLKKCKANGVSISAALFAVCGVAWARMGLGSKELPLLMYSALNLRSSFSANRQSLWDSYWFLAIGYFNVILPNFLPADKAQHEPIFWHRARQAKEQSTRAAKHPLLISRTHEMAKDRGSRARAWAKEDDDKEKGVWTPPTPPLDTTPAPKQPPREPVLPARVKASASALIGLSLLGNLDGVYKHAAFPSIQLHTLTTGSRQRHGAMLLFGYTFARKLWVSLGYDENGFSEGVVERFWSESVGVLEEFLG